MYILVIRSVNRYIQLILTRNFNGEKTDKSGEDASSRKIAEWLEADFMDSLAEGIYDALDEDAEDTERAATDDTDEE